MLLRIALAVSEKKIEKKLVKHFEKFDYLLLFPENSNLLGALGSEPSDVIVVSEVLLPVPFSDSIKMITSLPELPVLVVIAESGDESYHAQLLAEGVDVVLHSKLSDADIAAAIEGVAQKKFASRSNIIRARQLTTEPRLSDFVSNSRSMLSFINIARRVVKSDTSVLILGETGVGKERLALALHSEGARSMGPFIPINCAALPDNLLESELFGHEQGAFTGAVRARRGAFEMAHEGTIFLDEIGDMPLSLQVKLLRVLQDRKFMKIGGERTIDVNVRVMAATNRNLAAEVEAGRFRRDLYYRLSVVSLLIPPLRERKEDIPELVQSYIEYFSPRIGVEVNDIDDAALDALSEYSWPGNVRELINVIERAMLLCDGDIISVSELPDEISTSQRQGKQDAALLTALAGGISSRPWKEVRGEVVAYYERIYLTELLAENRGRIADSAAAAGMTTRALNEKMREYNLDKKDFKSR